MQYLERDGKVLISEILPAPLNLQHILIPLTFRSQIGCFIRTDRIVAKISIEM